LEASNTVGQAPVLGGPGDSALCTWTFMVNPETPEDNKNTLSMEPLLLFAGEPVVVTTLNVPPVTVPGVSTRRVFAVGVAPSL
jgi:hypothetical protein